VADAVNMLNREGTKYFKAASSGQAAKAEGRDSIAVGQGAVSRGQNSIAMGNGAEVTRQAAAGSVAVGSHARAGRANTGTYALNGQAVAGRTGSDTAVVSFGQPGQERQLQSVAPGVLSANSTDAVNGSQLHATNRQVAGNTQAINTLGNKFSQLSYRVEELNRDIRGVGASAAAMSGIPQAYLPGKSLMGLGVGGYGGESAIAIGVSRISDNGKMIMKLNAGQNTRGNFSVGAGVGWQW
ncbi:YadA-like family protein, partial [Escherichia coli]